MPENVLHVMLLEDDPGHAELARRAFEAAPRPTRLELAGSLAELRALLAQERPQVIIADLLLPDGHGTDLLLGSDPVRDVPIVVLTSHGSEERAVEAMKAGAVDYVLKTEATLADLPEIAERALRTWQHIQELRRTEEALRRSEERMRAIVSTAVDGIITIDEFGTIDSFNAAAERLFGYSAAEIIGQNVRLLMPSPYREAHDGYLARYRATGETRIIGRGRELLGQRKDGSTFPLELAVGEMWLGGKRYFAGFVHDRTEHIRLEEQFRQAQKMEAIGRLAGGIAHDFNNLLTVINGYAELLSVGLGGGHTLAPLAEEVRHAGERAALLTRQLLAFSRKQVVSPVSLRLDAVVGGVERMLRRVIGEDIELRTAVGPNIGLVRADLGQMEQLLMNLAINARDAMPQGGTLSIVAANVDVAAGAPAGPAPGPRVVLTVSDTGCGMDAETLSHIYEPFFTTKPAGKGTGLGLATVYGIVQQNEGHIEVESIVNQGTTFRIYFPRLPEAAATRRAPLVPSPEPPQGNEVILLVEDDDSVRRLAQSVLEARGYTVHPMTDGPEAIRFVEGHAGEIHLLLTDVVMPQMSGRELVQKLLGRLPHLRVIYMSGYTDDEVLRHGLRHEEAAYLEKPFTPLALARKVREVLDPKR